MDFLKDPLLNGIVFLGQCSNNSILFQDYLGQTAQFFFVKVAFLNTCLLRSNEFHEKKNKAVKVNSTFW